jgi:hypothetical protein
MSQPPYQFGKTNSKFNHPLQNKAHKDEFTCMTETGQFVEFVSSRTLQCTWSDFDQTSRS